MICAICHAATPARARSCSACGGDPVLHGRYDLEALLGQGGAGATFRARDRDTGRAVAIKELSVRKVDSLKTLELFERETKVLARLRCPDVPRYVDDFTVERPGQVYLYLVQELIDGATLAGVSLDEPATLALIAELCDVLAALHGERPPVVHRDLKPSNLMRRTDGRLVVIDFGAVRAVAANSLGGSTVAGTFGYMAPEQLRGQATPKSDLYAVGATAVALLSGRDAAELIDPFHPGGWTRAVRAGERTRSLIGRLLAVEPDARPKDARAVADEARRLLAGLAPVDPTASSDRTGPPIPAFDPPPRGTRASLAFPDGARVARRLRSEWRRVRSAERWQDTGPYEILWPAVMGFIFPSFLAGGVVEWCNPGDSQLPFGYRLIPGAVVAALILAWSLSGKLVRARKNPWRHGRIRTAILGAWTETTEWSGSLRSEIDEDDPKYLARYVDSDLREAQKAWSRTPWKLIPVYEAIAYRLAHGGEHAAAAAELDRAIAAARAGFGDDDVRTLTLVRQYAAQRVMSVGHEALAVAERKHAEAALTALETRAGRSRDALLADALAGLGDADHARFAAVPTEAARRALRGLRRRRRLRGLLPRPGAWGEMVGAVFLGAVFGFFPLSLVVAGVYAAVTGDEASFPVILASAATPPAFLLAAGAVWHGRDRRPQDFRVGLFRDVDVVWPEGARHRARFLELSTEVWRSPYRPPQSAHNTYAALARRADPDDIQAMLEGLERGENLASLMSRRAGKGKREERELTIAQITQLAELRVFLVSGVENTFEAVGALDALPVRDPRPRAAALLRAAMSCADAKTWDAAERLAARALALDSTAVEVL